MRASDLTKLVAAGAAVALSACEQSPQPVDTTIDKPAVVETTATTAPSPTAEVEQAAGAELPPITASWLVGTWGPAQANPQNDPNSSCETDVIIRFHRDGTFEDSGSAGKYSTNGQVIRYFDRQTVPSYEDDPDTFVAEALEDFVGTVAAVDRNTFDEDGDRWRRCVSG